MPFDDNGFWQDQFLSTTIAGNAITTSNGFPASGNTVVFYPAAHFSHFGSGQQLASDIDNTRNGPGGSLEVNDPQEFGNAQANVRIDREALYTHYQALYNGVQNPFGREVAPKPKPTEEVEEVPGRKARLVNKFLVGCDPEFVTIHNGRRCNVDEHLPHQGVVGWDHGGRIAEIRPDPSRGAYRLIKTMQKVLLEEPTLQQLVHRKWRAGAVYSDGRSIESLGGHIHIDIPWDKKEAPVKALDALTKKLEALDILPKDESNDRRNNRGYGRYGDARPADGGYGGYRIEYRTMASWLFNPAIAFVCLSGAKLAAHAPGSTLAALKGPTSYKQLIKFFELFQGKDDNADRVLERVLDGGNLKADPDADVRKAWERLEF